MSYDGRAVAGDIAARVLGSAAPSLVQGGTPADAWVEAHRGKPSEARLGQPCAMQQVLRVLIPEEPDHDPAVYGVLHLESVGELECAELAVCPDCVLEFRTGHHRVRSL